LARPGLRGLQRTGSIDPAAVRDRRRARYLVWKQMGAGNGIFGARLSPSGRRIVSTPVRLTLPNEPWEQGVTEGPDIVRNGDQYVLVYSGGHCCRPPCSYAVGVARSPALLGPYSKDPGTRCSRRQRLEVPGSRDDRRRAGRGPRLPAPRRARRKTRSTSIARRSWTRCRGIRTGGRSSAAGRADRAGDTDDRLELHDRFFRPFLDPACSGPTTARPR